MTPRECVLALAPVYRGVGYIVFDADRTPIDWGVKETRRNKNALCLARTLTLLKIFQPTCLVLELTATPGSRRRDRVRRLIADLAQLAESKGAVVASYSRTQIFAALDLNVRANKDMLAKAVASAVPELAHRLPKPRKLWESEKHSMAVFEAASLALAHFSARGAA